MHSRYFLKICVTDVNWQPVFNFKYQRSILYCKTNMVWTQVPQTDKLVCHDDDKSHSSLLIRSISFMTHWKHFYSALSSLQKPHIPQDTNNWDFNCLKNEIKLLKVGKPWCLHGFISFYNRGPSSTTSQMKMFNFFLFLTKIAFECKKKQLEKLSHWCSDKESQPHCFGFKGNHHKLIHYTWR